MIESHRVIRPSVSATRTEGERLLERRRYVGRLLRSQHGADRCRSIVEHIRSILADPHVSPEPAASQNGLRRTRPRRALRAGARQHCVPGIHHFGRVGKIILGHACRVNSYAVVEDSILLDGVDVGRYAKIRRAIIDKGVAIPQGVKIGYDPEEDRRRGFVVSDTGIVVIAKTAGSEQLFEPPA